jgi:hypothetical protein
VKTCRLPAERLCPSVMRVQVGRAGPGTRGGRGDKIEIRCLGKGKGKFYDPCRRFVCSSFILQSRIDCLERRRAFRSGHPRPCVIDLLTRHVSAHIPLLPPSARPRLSSTLLPCMADSFSLLINDSSPILSYFPFADTLSIPNFFEGWNPCFSISACPTFPGAQGNGSSFHVTSKDGAAFSIQWWGTP